METKSFHLLWGPSLKKRPKLFRILGSSHAQTLEATKTKGGLSQRWT